MSLNFVLECVILILSAPAFPYDVAVFLFSCGELLAYDWSLSKSLGSQSIIPLMA